MVDFNSAIRDLRRVIPGNSRSSSLCGEDFFEPLPRLKNRDLRANTASASVSTERGTSDPESGGDGEFPAGWLEGPFPALCKVGRASWEALLVLGFEDARTACRPRRICFSILIAIQGSPGLRVALSIENASLSHFGRACRHRSICPPVS